VCKNRFYFENCLTFYGGTISKVNSLPYNCYVLLKNVLKYSSFRKWLCFKTFGVAEHVVHFTKVKPSRYMPGQALRVARG
jgi:hypothetical protein